MALLFISGSPCRLIVCRAKAETDLGPNLVEIPAGKLEVENATQEKGSSSSKASNLQSPTIESKSRWWPF
jgi:hypothetical protein